VRSGKAKRSLKRSGTFPREEKDGTLDMSNHCGKLAPDERQRFPCVHNP
jgi:hypothetical protein